MKKVVLLLSVMLLGIAASAYALEVKTPIIATTCGQTPGAMMVKMSAAQAKVTPAVPMPPMKKRSRRSCPFRTSSSS